MLRPRSLRIPATALTLAAFSLSFSLAQFGPQAMFQPGQALPQTLLQNEGGPAGRELAPLVGRRPVLILYWQPKNAAAEAALIGAYAAVKQAAPNVTFFPVAVLAAGQSPADIVKGLQSLGMSSESARIDGGQLAQILGVSKLPTFALLDAGGVLRLVGGSDISQNSAQGSSIFDAVQLANAGQPVPTLGVLGAKPVFRMLGRALPELTVTELDGKTWRKVNDLVGKKKRTLLVYWLASCSHCREELPKLKDWYLRNKPTDLEVIDLARGDVEQLRLEAGQFIGNFPWNAHFLDTTTEAGKRIMAVETPSAYLIGEKGEILGIQVGGGINWDKWLGHATGR